jgi:TetR/AcrR family transcriptional repressor for divergent bdcA
VLDGARSSGDAEAVALTRRKMEESQALIAARIAAEAPDRADRLASIVVTALKGLSAAARDGASPDELRAFADAAAAGFRVALGEK